MNISIGKTISVLIFLLSSTIFAGEKILYEDDFESSIPGKRPSKWGIQVWGKQGSDTFRITSETSVSGNNCLQYERTTGNTGWQNALWLPLLKHGKLDLSFHFMWTGKPNTSRYTWNLRRNGKMETLYLFLGGSSFSVSAFSKGTTLKNIPIESGKWYGVSLSIPLTEEEGKNMTLSLTEKETGKKQTIELPWKHLTTPASYSLFMDLPGSNVNTSLFLDDFRITNQTKK